MLSNFKLKEVYVNTTSTVLVSTISCPSVKYHVVNSIPFNDYFLSLLKNFILKFIIVGQNSYSENSDNDSEFYVVILEEGF